MPEEDAMRRSARTMIGISLAVAALTGAGCAEDFESFNLLSGLRVMAVKAEPPELLPGESAQIEALVYEPDGDQVDYQWSWCPLAMGAATGFECAVTEQDIADMASAFFPGAELFVPSFDLGTEETAVFDHSIDPIILQGLCSAILSSGAPSFVTLPDCEDEIVVTIKLTVAAGGEEVVAVKELALKMDDGAAVNSNPTIGRVEAREGADGQWEVLEEDGLLGLAGGKRYDLFVDVPQESAEAYVPDPTEETPEPEETTEALFMTWFVTGGSTDFNRTTYLHDEIGLYELGANKWKTPRLDETTGGDATLFLVLQDERGGVEWTQRVVEILEP